MSYKLPMNMLPRPRLSENDSQAALWIAALFCIIVLMNPTGLKAESQKDQGGFREAASDYSKQSREFSRKAAAEKSPERAEIYQKLSGNYAEMSKMKREAERLQRQRKDQQMDWTEYHKLQGENSKLEKSLGDTDKPDKYKEAHPKKESPSQMDAESRYRKQAQEAKDQIAKEKKPERIRSFEKLAANYEKMADMKKKAGELASQGKGGEMDWSDYHTLEGENAELLKQLAFSGGE